MKGTPSLPIRKDVELAAHEEAPGRKHCDDQFNQNNADDEKQHQPRQAAQTTQ